MFIVDGPVGFLTRGGYYCVLYSYCKGRLLVCPGWSIVYKFALMPGVKHVLHTRRGILKPVIRNESFSLSKFKKKKKVLNTFSCTGRGKRVGDVGEPVTQADGLLERSPVLTNQIVGCGPRRSKMAAPVSLATARCGRQRAREDQWQER